MPTIQEIEAAIRQHAGLPMQNAIGPNSGMAQGADAPIDAARAMAAKQAALAAMGSSGGAPPTPQAPPPIPQVQGNDPLMTSQDAASRMNAMISSPISGGAPPMGLDQAMAARQAMLNQNNLAAPAAGLPSDLMPPTAPPVIPQDKAQKIIKNQANQEDSDRAAKPRQFSNIRDRLKGPQEVTPELEKQLGYGADAEDEEDVGKNTRGSTKDTGTLGGV